MKYLMVSYYPFCPVPNSLLVDGLPTTYFAFVHCDSEELLRQVYSVSDIGVFAFETPAPGYAPAKGWRYEICPPIDGSMFQVTWFSNLGDRLSTRNPMTTSKVPSLNMLETTIWTFTTVSDLERKQRLEGNYKPSDTHRYVLRNRMTQGSWNPEY